MNNVDRKPMRYFLDWEFFEDGERIIPISLGVVSEDGRELCCVNSDFDWNVYEAWSKQTGDDWLKRNVLPHLPSRDDARCMPKRAIRDALVAFVGDTKPEFWGYYADYDWIATCQLFGRMIDIPEHFPKMCMDLKQWQIQLGRPPLPPQKGNEHDALFDARWNREVFFALKRHATDINF